MTATQQQPQAIILKTKSGQWLYEIWIGDEMEAGGAGFQSEGEAIEAAIDDHPNLSLNIVLRNSL